MLKVKPPEEILVVKRGSKKRVYQDTAFGFPAPDETITGGGGTTTTTTTKPKAKEKKTRSESRRTSANTSQGEIGGGGSLFEDEDIETDGLIVDDCSVHSSVPKSRTSSILSLTIPTPKPFTLTVTDTSLAARTPTSVRQEDDYWRYFQDTSQLNFVVTGGSDTIIGRKDAKLLLANYRGVDESMISDDDNAVGYLCGRTVKGLRDFISALAESGPHGMRVIRELSVGTAKGRTKTLLIQIQQKRIEAHIRMHSTLTPIDSFGSAMALSEAEFVDIDPDSGFTREHLPDRSWSDEDLEELIGEDGSSVPSPRSHHSSHNVNRTRISIYDIDIDEEELKASEPSGMERMSGAGFSMLSVPSSMGGSSGSGSSGSGRSGAISSFSSIAKQHRRRSSTKRHSSKGMSLLSSPLNGRFSTSVGGVGSSTLSHLRTLTYNLELWSCEEDDLDLGDMDIDDEYADVLCSVESPPDTSPFLSLRDTDSSLMGVSSLCDDDSPGAAVTGHEPRKSTLSVSAEIEFWDPTGSCLSTRSTGSNSSSEIDFSVSRQLSVSVSDCLARMMHAPCGV